MFEKFESINNDIYKTWGENTKRIDLPAYGPEYYEWELSTTLEIQKIVLDYLISRKFEILINRQKRNKYLEEQIPKDEYDIFREYAISKADEVAITVYDFLNKKGVDCVSNILAVGLDGSSLYKPDYSGQIVPPIPGQTVPPFSG